MTNDAARQVMELYPHIYFACHTRHVRDPRTHRVLSAHQASILDPLDEREPRTLLDLARHMGVTASTMVFTRRKIGPPRVRFAAAGQRRRPEAQIAADAGWRSPERSEIRP